jgi:hypothetical protein
MQNYEDHLTSTAPTFHVAVSQQIEISRIKSIGKGNHSSLLKRWGHSSIVHGGHLYIFAGEVKSSQSSVTNTVLKICLEDFENNCFLRASLSEQQNGILERDSHSSVVCKDMWVNLFGHSGGNSVNQIIAFSFSNRSLSILNLRGPVTPRECHSSCIVSDRVIVTIGGATVKDNKTLSPFHPLPLNVIDLKNNSSYECSLTKVIGWEHFGSRKDHSISEYTNDFYVFGGHALFTKSKCLDEEIFSDLIKIKVELVDIRSVPKKGSHNQETLRLDSNHSVRITMERINYAGRKVHLHSHTSSIINRNLMVMVGGETYNWALGIDIVKYNESVYCYSFEQNCMWEIDDLRQRIPGRISHSAAVSGSSIYIFGGINEEKELLNDTLIISFKFDQKINESIMPMEDGICHSCEKRLEQSWKKVTYASNLKTTEGTIGYASKLFDPNPSLETLETEPEWDSRTLKPRLSDFGIQQKIQDNAFFIQMNQVSFAVENKAEQLIEQAQLFSHSISDEISAVLNIMRFLKGRTVQVQHFPNKIQFEISDSESNRLFASKILIQHDSEETEHHLVRLNAIASLMYFGSSKIHLLDTEIDVDSRKVTTCPSRGSSLIFFASKSNIKGSSLLTIEVITFILEHYYLTEKDSGLISVNGIPVRQKFWADNHIILPFNDECLGEYFFERGSDKNLALFYWDGCLVKFYLLAFNAFVLITIKHFDGDLLRKTFSVRLENKLMNVFLRLKMTDA